MGNLEKECGTKCRSRQHVGELVVAVSKGNLKQIKLFLSKCHNFTTLSDNYGRTVLHVAASCGKWQVMDWLISECGMELGAKDLESGWTALHRCLFYGQIGAARLLISYGASTSVRDKEGLSPLDLIMMDRLPYVEYVGSGLQEVYTWGENSNFTLGHETENRRKNPEMVEFFRKRNLSIKQVSMNKYHTIFLTAAGQIYSCGHGRGGRLGLGCENTVLEPTLVDSLKSDVCKQVHAARDHSLFLMEGGTLYSCGMNDYNQLGVFPAPPACLHPKQVNGKQLKGRVIKGVCAQRFHTVVYTNDAVFTFGLNAGQLGHMKVAGEKIVSQPRQVSALNHKDTKIELVACSDGATVVYTSRGDVYVLHEYQCRRIISKRLSLVYVAVTGGHLDHSTDKETLSERGGDELVIALLNMSGVVFLWRSCDPTLRRCSWSGKRCVHVTQLALSLQGLVCITKDGDGFTAALPKVKPKTSAAKTTPSKQDKESFDSAWTITELVNKDEIVDVSMEKLAGVHRATAVASDRKGRNYAVLQCQPNACLTEIPQLRESQMISNFNTLLNESDCFDSVHDCILEVDNNRIAAHQYILAYKSDYFNKIFSVKSEESILGEKPVIDLNGNNIHLFRQLLAFLYTDNCDMLIVGKTLEADKFAGSDGASSQVDYPRSLDYIEVDRADRKKSAFEVFSAQKKGKTRGTNKDKQKHDEKRGPQAKNPVQALQEMARKFGVKSLANRLEAVRFVQGQVQRVKGGHLPKPTIHLGRTKLKHLYDVTLKCQDGQLIEAHRCVLVAGLEYFRSMLASGWIETSTTEPLSIPVQGDVMCVILDYLYTGGSAVIDSSDDAEFLMNVLVVADQLLMTRLREMCEVAIASQISLKNSCELLELSTFYNAHQLKTTCQQFVCLNLAALLESHSLDVLTQPVVDELTQYYRDLVPGMSRRVITPYSGFPTREYLQELETCDGATTTKQRKDSASKEPGSARKTKARKKRSRLKSSGEDQGLGDREERNSESRCSDNELRISFCSDTEQTLDDLSEESTSRDSPREACSLASRTAESLQRKKLPPTIVIPKTSKPMVWGGHTSPTGPSPPTPPPSSSLPATSPSCQAGRTPDTQDHEESGGVLTAEGVVGLRDIMAQQANEVTVHEVKTALTPKKKSSSKLSQKERKRMAQENRQKVETSGEPQAPSVSAGTKPKVWSSPANAWGANSAQTSKVIKSFKDLVVEEEQHVRSYLPTPPSPACISATNLSHDAGAAGDAASRSLAIRNEYPKVTSHASPPSEPTSPRSPSDNPWQMVPAPRKCMPKAVSFSEIIEDETKQNESLQKIANKPLNLIQIEEQAMQELLALYKEKETVPNVRFSVERTSVTMATPTWTAKQAPKLG